MFSGFNNVGIVPAGSLANASSTGAKTVKSPSPLSVPAKPAAFTAAKRVDRAGDAPAVTAMFANEDEVLVAPCPLEYLRDKQKISSLANPKE